MLRAAATVGTTGSPLFRIGLHSRAGSHLIDPIALTPDETGHDG
jgi:hypothetical protein